MAERSIGNDLATIGVGIGIPLTFVLGVILLLLTALTGKAPIWLAGPFVLIGAGSGVSYVVVRRGRR